MATKFDDVIRGSTEVPIESQIAFSFVLGFIFAPWSAGIFLLLIVWEIIVAIITHKYWNPFVRAGIVAGSLLGWLAGRALTRTGIDEVGPVPRLLRGGAFIDNSNAHARRRIQIRQSILDHLCRSLRVTIPRLLV
jgi:hypothetical protein